MNQKTQQTPAFDVYDDGNSRGFQITFDNGVTVSIAFSNYNYGDQGATACETAMWDDTGAWIKRHSDDADNVQPYQTPADVLATLNFASTLDKT